MTWFISNTISAAKSDTPHGALLGAGLLALIPRGPNEEKVRRSARELVPAGFTVIRFESGYRGNFPTKGPFFAVVDATGVEDMAARDAAARAAADAAGWRLLGTQEFPGGRVLEYERDDLTASIRLTKLTALEPWQRAAAEEIYVSVHADAPPDRLGLGLIGTVLGAAMGALLAIVLPRRRSKLPDVSGGLQTPPATGPAT